MVARTTVTERLQALVEEAPGDRLPPERRLAEDLGISRSTLREGLRRLVDLGIVEARPGSGTYVAPVDLEDLLDVRLRLEPYAARLAAERRGADDLERLEATLARLRAEVGNPAAFAAADSELHRAVVDASGSRALRVLLAALTDLLRHSRDTTAPDDAVRSATVAAMERLVGAVRAGDAGAAEQAMEEHLRDVGQALARRGRGARR